MTKDSRSVTFVVAGIGPFPFDMLRFDACWPDSTDDARKMGWSFGDPPEEKRREIMLRTNYLTAPTHARWESFNWRVMRYGTESAS